MNVSIHFPAEIEQALQRKAAAAGLDVATFVQHVIAEEVGEEPEPEPAPRIPRDEYECRLRAWVKLHPVLDHAIDDSRESFYAGRGE